MTKRQPSKSRRKAPPQWTSMKEVLKREGPPEAASARIVGVLRSSAKRMADLIEPLIHRRPTKAEVEILKTEAARLYRAARGLDRYATASAGRFDPNTPRPKIKQPPKGTGWHLGARELPPPGTMSKPGSHGDGKHRKR